MKLLYGLQDGGLLCRRGETCDVIFAAQAQGTVKVSLGCVEPMEDNRYRLTGIPVGGAYELTISDDISSLTLQVWVGDLWLLAGQSNMEGAGTLDEEEKAYCLSPSPGLRSMDSQNRWGAATALLHAPWNAEEPAYRDFWIKGNTLPSGTLRCPAVAHSVGPGLYFAREMEVLTGVPQGVLPMALGGSCLAQWEPQPINGNNLYAASLRKVRAAGGRINGIFWYQGEAETSPEGVKAFPDRMEKLVSSFRTDLSSSDLPFTQVQLAYTHHPVILDDPQAAAGWEGIREAQRCLCRRIPHLATVAALDLSLNDLIHLDIDSHRLLGKRCAWAMADLCGYGGSPAPDIASVRILEGYDRPTLCALEVRPYNMASLISYGRPDGFALTRSPFPTVYSPCHGIARLRVERDRILIFTEYSAQVLRTCFLHYGFGNMSHASIRDTCGRALPGFGPLKLSDCLLQKSLTATENGI